MRKSFLFLLLSLAFLNGTQQHIWFSDDFVRGMNELWVKISGNWVVENGRLKVSSGNGSSIIGLNFFITPNSEYSLTVKFKGKELKLLFNSYELYTARVGNFVKFFNNAVYAGVIELGGEEKISSFATPSRVFDWNQIQVRVRNGKFSVYFNDRKLIEGLLYFSSGFPLLIVERRATEIDYFIISSPKKYVSINDYRRTGKAIVDHISSMAVVDSSTFVISSDVYLNVQVIKSGEVINNLSFLRWAGGVMYYNDGIYVCDEGRIRVIYPSRTFVVGEFFVKRPSYISADAERIYLIDEGVVKIFNKDFRLLSSFNDPENLRFPTAVTSDKYNIYCADPERGHIAVYLKSTGKFQRRIKGELISPVDLKYDSLSNSIFVADLGLRGIVKLRLGDDKIDKVLRCEKVGGLRFPRCIDVWKGKIFIADADRIVSADTTFDENSVRVVLKN